MKKIKNIKRCPRCGDRSMEELRTHSYCINCTYTREFAHYFINIRTLQLGGVRWFTPSFPEGLRWFPSLWRAFASCLPTSRSTTLILRWHSKRILRGHLIVIGDSTPKCWDQSDWCLSISRRCPLCRTRLYVACNKVRFCQFCDWCESDLQRRNRLGTR